MKTYPESYYTKEDLNKAFDMGLETAIDLIDKIRGLSYEGQSQIVAYLKKEIIESKIKYIITK